MLGVIKYFKQPGFQYADSSLTHLLFVKKWEENFYFKDIELEGKQWIEDQITPQFFDWSDHAAGQVNQTEESGFVEVAPEIKIEVTKENKTKKNLVSSIYKNLQEILELPGTSLERIRDTKLSTSKGLDEDFKKILTLIQKDDMLNPMPNSFLKLQEIYI